MHLRWRQLSACIGLIVPSTAWARSQATATNQPPPGQTTGSDTDRTATETPAGQAGGVEDIVVTAQRRLERLQTVPVAVSAASAARLEAAGVSNTQELAILTPGLSAPQTAGFAQPHVRGVGSSTAGAGLEQPVATSRTS